MKKSDPTSAYRTAFNEVVSRIQQSLKDARPDALPIRMYIAGGAAFHLLTGERVSEDIDATFSRRVLLNQDIEVSYRDPDGRARLLYLDRNSNDTLGLLHENAYRDSKPIDLPGVDPAMVEVRVLSATDLAVSKLARFSDQDREDVLALAKRGLITSASLRRRAEEALENYVGNTQPVRGSIDIACRLIDAERAQKAGAGKARSSKRPKR